MNSKTVTELRELAKEAGIENYYKLKKSELIEALINEKEEEQKEITTKEVVKEEPEDAEGILEVLADGFGFLRSDNYLSGTQDIYVSPIQIRRFNLKTGDKINCKVRPCREGERFRALIYVNSVNGDDVSIALRRKPFDQLVPIYPDYRLNLETTRQETATRLIDMIAPIGKGQRGMIVAPPKAGKTVLLKKIANAITTNYPDMELIVLLIDE